MYAWIAVNAFLRSPKFDDIYSRLKSAAEKQDITADIYTNADIIMCDGRFLNKSLKMPDFVIFWDKDILLAKQLESLGLRLFNSAEAIELCDDKAKTHTALLGKEIPIPKTIHVPMTYGSVGYTDTGFLDFAESELCYPFIAKECCGSFGSQVYLMQSRADALKLLKDCPNPLIFQQYIKNSRGRDIRINMVGDEPIASMYRYNNNDFRANITNGGSMKKYSPTDDEVRLAQKAMKALKLDFGGIDILFGDDGPIFCEANSNAHFKNIYDCTGINVADSIISYIKEQI